MTAMFLSRAVLRADASVRALAPLLLPDEPSARSLAAHRLVWSLMADGPDRRRDFLWREEKPGSFLILAPRPASGEAGLFEVSHKPWEPELRAGDQLGFLLRANPTIARSTAPGQRGKRSDVVMDAIYAMPAAERAAARATAIVTAGADWLARQGERHGFRLDRTGLAVDGYDTIQVPRAGGAATLGRLEFAGLLSLTSPEAFLRAVTQGFGRARAFGCGLMLLRRA